MRQKTIVFALLINGIFITPAWAQTSYQPYVLGLRTAGMGGSAVALGHDSASPWLNPAGVAGGGGQLALSANAGVLRLENAPDFYSLSANSPNAPTEGTESDRTSSEFSLFPTSILYTAAFGDHVVGLSLITPYQSAISEFTNFVIDRGTGPSLSDLSVRQGEVRLNDFGIVYGYDFGVGRVGFSGFLRYSTLRLAFDSQSIVYSIASADLSVTPFSLTDAAESLDIDLIAGVQLGPFSGFSFGLTVQAPSIHLTGGWEASTTQYSASTITDSVEFVDRQIRDGDYEVRLPLTLRLGIGYERPRSFALSADISLFFPVSEFDRLSGIQRTRVLSNDPDGSALPPPQEIAIKAEQELVINANVGVEVYLGRRFALRAGFFTDFSNQVDLPAEGARTGADVGLSRVDRFGGTLGIGYEGDLAQFQLSLVYLGGLGTVIGTEFNLNSGASNRFVDIEYSINTLMVVFSGEVDPSAIAAAAVRAAQEEMIRDD